MRVSKWAITLFVGLGITASAASASTTLFWNNSSGGSLMTPSNWSPAGTPSSTTALAFGLPGTYTVTIPQTVSVEYGSVTQGDLTFDGLGRTLTFLANNSITNPGFNIRGGDPGGLVKVKLLNGVFAADSCGVGDGPGTESILTIGKGAQLRVNVDFAVAYSNGNARLTIQNGGRLNVTSGGINIGQSQFAQAAATVTGVGSMITTPILAVSTGNTSSLLIDAGGEVRTTLLAHIGSYGRGHAAVRGNGSIWRNTGSAEFIVAPSSAQVGGKLAVLDGGVVNSATPVIVGTKGEVCGNSSIQAAVLNNGIVAPGAVFDDATQTVLSTGFIGTLMATGAYTQSATGKLNIELGSVSSFDVLSVGGTSSIAGTLNVSLLGGFVPLPGQTFPFLSSSARTGMFGTLNLPALPAGSSWDVQYSSSGASLFVVPAPSTAVLLGMSLVCVRRRRCC